MRCQRARRCGGPVIGRRAHGPTVPAAPDVMRGRLRPDANALVGSPRADADRLGLTPAAALAKAPIASNVASNELGRTNPFWASLESRLGAETPVFIDIWLFVLFAFRVEV